MIPASTYPARRDDVALVHLDPGTGSVRTGRIADLPLWLRPGDLVVLNDAATLPASLPAHDGTGRLVEVRIVAIHEASGDEASGHEASSDDACSIRAALFGVGDWRMRTEHRPPPPALPVGTPLVCAGLPATVVGVSHLSPRLVELRFAANRADLLAAIYQQGHPVIYAHLAHALPLWAVQTVYAGRPWAVEMPSAGRPLSWKILLALRRNGVELATLTHAAGLSATGDPTLDRALPLKERFDLPRSTIDAIDRTRRRAGRVLAVGTTVTRVLEGAAASGFLRPGPGETDLRLGPGHQPRVVDGLLSGLHTPGESHFDLLTAWAPRPKLAAAIAIAEDRGLRSHELGDTLLVWPP